MGFDGNANSVAIVLGEFLGDGGFATAENFIWQWMEETKAKESKTCIMFNQSFLILSCVTAPSNLSDPFPAALAQLPVCGGQQGV